MYFIHMLIKVPPGNSLVIALFLCYSVIMVIGQCLPTFFDLKFCQGNMNNCKLLHDNPSLSQKMYGILWQLATTIKINNI